MDNLSTYILEKLRINKDTKLENKLIDDFSIGDICLYFKFFPGDSSNPNFITVDVVKVTKFLSKSIICQYLTHIGVNKSINQLNFKYTDPQDDENVFIEWKDNKKRSTLIPTKYCEEIIDYIENKSGNKSISFYNLVRNKYKESSVGTLIVELYSTEKNIIWKNVTGIKNFSLNNIKKKLNI